MKLLAAPNVSEGRNFGRLELLEGSLGDVTLLDRHTDLDHNRTVFTVAGEPDRLEMALVGLGRVAAEIDMTAWRGIHPAIGALDVCPVIWTREEDRDLAAETALQIAIAIGRLGVPVFLYGELATAGARRERAFFRRGGVDRLWLRMSGGDPDDEGQILKPDFGPDRPHPTAGACLVTARPPLAAFNLELETGDVEIAREIAAVIREQQEGAGVTGGLPGVRALGLPLSTGRAQVSMNIHDPVSLPLARVVEAVRGQATARGTRVIAAELVGLIPGAALAGYPQDTPIRDFDPAYHVIENRI